MRALKRSFNSTVLQITRKRNICLFVFAVAVLAVLQIRFSNTQKQKNGRIDTSPMIHTETSWSDQGDLGHRKLIVVYSPRPEPWAPYRNEVPGYKFTDWDGTPCEESRCEITYDKALLHISDAVLVHAVNPQPTMEEMTRDRPSHQRWVFYNKESPATWPAITKDWNDLFNWTATYRRDSDFFVPYGSYVTLEVPRNTGTISQSMRSSGFNHAHGKDKMATFGCSNHCGGQRFAFVRALMNHISVGVYGKCASAFNTNNSWHCPHSARSCTKELERYKFYLAFENSRCIDYITEKYWRNSLERGLVPVVLGGASYDPELVIPGSFIAASDFDSVKSLADHLTYLDQNDTAYNQYFEWRSKYKAVKYKFWLCRLCKALHDPKIPAKSYHNLSEFWGVKETCKLGNQRVWNIINRG